MKFIIYALLMLLGFGLSYGLLPDIMPIIISVDVIFIMLICIAQLTKNYTAGFIGIVMGLMLDLFIYSNFGVNILFYFFASYSYAKICNKNSIDSVFICCLAIFAGVILKDLLYLLLATIQGAAFNFWGMFLKFILPSAAVSAVLGFIIYFALYKIHELEPLRVRRELNFLRDYVEKNEWIGNFFE